MTDTALQRARRFTRRPAFLGALAAGVFTTVCVDLAPRRRCPPTSSFFNFAPSGSMVAVLRVEDWDVPLSGFAAGSWAWADVDLSAADRDPPSKLWQTTAGEPNPPTPVGEVVSRYRAPSLIDVAPVDAYFGAAVRIRATQFGFPFRSSVRETVWGVLYRKAQTCAETNKTRPAALAVCIDSGWAWSRDPSEADRQRAANGGWSHRQWVFPLGVLANWALYTALLFPVFAAPVALRTRIRVRQGRCIACGYLLHGIDGAKCPECGTLSSVR